VTEPTVLLDASGNLRVSFDYDAAMVERIKTIPGAAWVKAGRYWALPIGSLDRLMREFGDALAIHPDVAMAASDRTPAIHFAGVLRQAGITLTDVDGRLVGSGGCYCIDPWQRLIDERSAALRALGYPSINSHAKRNVGTASADSGQFSATSKPANPVDLSQLTEWDKMAAKHWGAWVENDADEKAIAEAAKNRRWQKQTELVSE
jgi:hypothetical protein